MHPGLSTRSGLRGFRSKSTILSCATWRIFKNSCKEGTIWLITSTAHTASFSESVGGVVAETQSAFVYVGTAPVNLIRGYAGAVNTPILLRTFDAAKRLVGYSDDWATFTLCEAIQTAF